MKEYIKLIRLKHWLKNFLIFLPIFFSGRIFNINYIKPTLLAFFIFSLTASVVYIINDIEDVEKDKKHPIKRDRPIASGKISIRNAIFIIAFFSLCLLFLNYYIFIITQSVISILLPIIYIIINILYSKFLKTIPILDVFIIVCGFLIRLLYGAVIVDINISKWLYLVIIFLSFYLGFGKRRNEIIKNGNKSRPVLKYYTKDFLDKNMYVCLGLAIVAYSLWSVDPVTVTRVGNDYLFLTIPFVMIILQIYSLDIEKESFGDPVEVLCSNKVLLSLAILYVLIMVFLIYIV